MMTLSLPVTDADAVIVTLFHPCSLQFLSHSDSFSLSPVHGISPGFCSIRALAPRSRCIPTSGTWSYTYTIAIRT